MEIRRHPFDFKDVINRLKAALIGQCQDEIVLNLNIALSNFEAEIIILLLATEAETKNGVEYLRSV